MDQRYQEDVKKGYQKLITHLQSSHSDWKTKTPQVQVQDRWMFLYFLRVTSKRRTYLVGWAGSIMKDTFSAWFRKKEHANIPNWSLCHNQLS